ncbi:hypothetical protein JKP88DRAFT_330058 [Tribonema minus]|uniref:Uncharacterized protein n=1 Tax=Tribonema minus TaxID=303371 RepID=A0A835YQP2_9STRA|nr:hypothetical protein JKP88DRAFT_330058 [Tribonema minus]
MVDADANSEPHYPSDVPFSLDRYDLAQVATTSHRGTLALLPSKKGKQKFVVGDDAGDVRVFEMKRGELQEAAVYSELGGPITALAVDALDRIFATQGSRIAGLTRKGKEFFKMGSTLTETMHHLAVDGTFIFTGCEFIFNLYDDGKDVAFHMCHDRIGALIVVRGMAGDGGAVAVLGCANHSVIVVRGGDVVARASVSGPGGTVAVLGCANHSVIVVRGGDVVARASVSGPVTALLHAGSGHIYYGTEDGTVGLLDYANTITGGGSGSESMITLQEMWLLSGGSAGVTALDACDLTGNGRAELVVGRDDGAIQLVVGRDDGAIQLDMGSDDGAIQVFGFPAAADGGSGGSSGGGTFAAGGSFAQGAERLLFEAALGESVRALQCGVVSAAGYKEVVVLGLSGAWGIVSAAAYKEVVVLGLSGTVVGYTTEPLGRVDAGDEGGRTVGVVQTENRVRQLQKEVQELQRKVAAEREKALSAAKLSAAKGGEGGGPALMPHVQPFQALATCALDADAAAYRMNVEIPVPIDVVLLQIEIPVLIDMVLLQSSIHLDFLDVSDESQASAVCTVCAPAAGNAAALMAVYSAAALMAVCSAPTLMAAYCRQEGTRRLMEGTRRLMIRVRTTEGDSGDVSLTVVARPEGGGGGGGGEAQGAISRKNAQVVKFKIRPLSLHHRVHAERGQEEKWPEPGEEAPGPPMNELRLTGGFTLGVVHDWVAQCLPGVPPEAQSDTMNLKFRNAFTGSVLTCRYRKGEAVARSDSASALAILREAFETGAIQRRIHLSHNYQPCRASVPRMLDLLRPKLEALLALSRQHALINAIRELAQAEGGGGGGGSPPWLSPEYANILANATTIEKYAGILANATMKKKARARVAEFKARPRALEYVGGIITDLFVDWHKLQGHDVKHRIPDVEAAVLSGDLGAAAGLFAEA